MAERREKKDKLLLAVAKREVDEARRLFSEIFRGVSSGKRADPGMEGSLLYHMAMVTKMETETKILLDELGADMPPVDSSLVRFFTEFASDAKELTKQIVQLNLDPQAIATSKDLSSEEKIALFTGLTKKTAAVERQLSSLSSEIERSVEDLFSEWTQQVAEMRLRQEYETIKGLLVTAELAKALGIKNLQAAMTRVQSKFGEETVSIALKVTLRVGMKREKLQSIMLADHYIDYTMNIDKLDGRMKFLNCPIFGSHKYIGDELGIGESVSALFCRHFCLAHAEAMLSTVLPFTFALSQPQRMGTHGKCEFYLKLGYSPMASVSERFVPLVVSWNVTRKCNMKCPHCYINATDEELVNELSTDEAKRLIDQIATVSRPMLDI